MCKIARFREFVRLRLRRNYTRRGCSARRVFSLWQNGFLWHFAPSLAFGSVERFAEVFTVAPGRASAQKSQDVRSSILSPKKIAGSIGN